MDHIRINLLYESQECIDCHPRPGSTATFGDVLGRPCMILLIDRCALSSSSMALLGKHNNSKPYVILGMTIIIIMQNPAW